jgi:hypothetical protein
MVWLGPSSRQWTLVLSRPGEPRGTRLCPLFWVADQWAAVSVFKTGMSLVGLMGALFRSNPSSNIFCIFQNEPSV